MGSAALVVLLPLAPPQGQPSNPSDPRRTVTAAYADGSTKEREVIRLGVSVTGPYDRMRWCEERERSGREYECSVDCDACWRSELYRRGLAVIAEATG